MLAWESISDGEDEGEVQIDQLNVQRSMVENAGLPVDLLDSWDLNPLELDKARNMAAMKFFVGPHNHGVHFDPIIMNLFLEEVERGYMPQKVCPYHNWFHAVDVTHGVYRLLYMCASE